MPEEQESSGPSLEPPSLFRRKKKKPEPPEPPEPSEPSEPQGEDSPTTILDDTPAAPASSPGPKPRSKPGPKPGPKPTAPPPSVAPPSVPPPPFADDEPTETLQAQAPLQTPVPAPTAVDTPPRPAKPPRTFPVVPGRVAAALAGVLVGALIVGLTSASFELCSRIQGTSSCGGPGIFLLLAILVLGVVVGTLVLRLCQVPEPGSTSFLAVGLTSVVALLFLIDALFEWWMIIVIPLVAVATFLLSHWVTTTFVEPAHD